VTITDIWTKFGTADKYHTTNTPEWPNSHKLKIQDGGGRHLEFRKNINNSGLDKDICTKFHGKTHQGHTEMTTWPKVETGSQFAWRHQLKVWSICASISVTIIDIWTKFGTEHKYHTTNTLKWPNSPKLKIQDGGDRHLEFRKNVKNFGLDKDILHQIIWEDAPRRREADHVTKSRNRKLIRVTLSNEGLKHMCVYLSDYNRYLNQMWYRTQILPYQHAGMAKFT